MTLKTRQILALLCVCIPVSSASAKLELGTPFTENMVVQHDKPLTVWGWDDPDQTVVVKFAGEEATATANSDGFWELEIATPAPGGPTVSKSGRAAK